MVDRKARDEYAQLLRHFVAGRVLNLDYDNQVLKSAWYKAWTTKDRVLEEVYDRVWAVYCDFRKHFLSGKDALTKEQRKIAARYILFLHSDLEYEWDAPETHLMRWEWLMGIDPQHPRIPGDERVWPFYRQGDLDQAKAHPRLLAGRKSA